MNEVKRYDLVSDESVWEEVSPAGEFIKYKDYAALEAECENWSNQCSVLIKERDKLAAENLALKSAIECHMAGFSVCEACGEDNTCGNDDVGIVLKETPVTEAYANQLRAEGVEMFAKYISLYSSNAKSHADEFTANLRKESGNE